MRFLMIAALLPLAASFASTAKPPYEPPEGLALIRDSYQFDNTEHPMTGLTPDSPGPHKLIVVVQGLDDLAYPLNGFCTHCVTSRRRDATRGSSSLVRSRSPELLLVCSV